MSRDNALMHADFIFIVREKFN